MGRILLQDTLKKPLRPDTFLLYFCPLEMLENKLLLFLATWFGSSIMSVLGKQYNTYYNTAMTL